MTEEQVKKWQKRRDEAKQIEDPRAREAALDLVYDMKDDMQLDCQRKMADRIKDLVKSDGEQRGEIIGIKATVDAMKKDFDQRESELAADHATVQEYRDNKMRASGAMQLLKLLGYLLAAGGGSVVTLVLHAVNKAGGVQ